MGARLRGALLTLTTLAVFGSAVAFWVTAIVRSHEPTLTEVRALARGKEFVQARARLASYLRGHPADSAAHFLMGQIATDGREPQPELALEHLGRVRAASQGEAARVRFFEGKAHYMGRRYDLSEVCWRDALRLDPSVPEAGYALFDLLDLEGRVEDAHAVGMRQHEVESDRSDRVRILLEVARIDIDKVAPGSLVQMFEPLHREQPGNLAIGIVVGLGLVHDSRGEQGVEVLREVLRGHPDDPDAWDAWFTGLADAGQRDRIAGEYARLPARFARETRFAKHEGRVAQEARNWKAAALAYRRAYAAEPHDGVLLYRLHRALRLAGETEEAESVERRLTDFQSAFKELRPAHRDAQRAISTEGGPCREIYQRLASLRERMGRADEARAWHRLVLRERPGDPLSLAALARLD
jgi:tetratricopeptide (TPR) repeat protein